MTIDELIDSFPRLYHMAEGGTWESIRKHGLLSTTALLDLFELDGQHRRQIESAHRPECVTITHPVHGKAVIRDQKPMQESTLLKCLRGLTASEWYEFLNRRTFFWLHSDRLTTLLNAKAYRGQSTTLLPEGGTASTRLPIILSRKDEGPEAEKTPSQSWQLSIRCQMSATW